ncbi:MAG TPA: hypothetical protein VFI53_11755 [Myxococcaceae bacterium]|nr:hypothetical protein [Myxococcaceae bacterium]
MVLVLLGAATLKAFRDFDIAWDSIAYHLPFAALKTHIVDPARYELTGMLRYYYDGFPAFPSYLKGGLWMALGKPEAPNLVALLSFFCLPLYVWRVWRLPFSWTVIALLAIPAVQVSVTRNQIDLPANVFMSVLVLSLCDAAARPLEFGPAKALVAALAAAMAANFKPQMVVHVGVLAVVALVLVVMATRRKVQVPLLQSARAHPLGAAAALVLAVPLVFAAPLSNWIQRGNPFYPIRVSVLGQTLFPGPLPPSGLWPEPVYSAHYPQALRWLLSVLEFRAFDSRPIPYTLGNGDVPIGAMSMRVGGYMGLLVIVAIGLFVLAARARKDRLSTTFAVMLGLTGLLSAITPGSHELRYASYWMICLVLSTFILVNPDNTLRTVYRLVLAATLAWVISITGAQHFLPTGRNFAYYQRTMGITDRLERTVHDGETVCLDSFPQSAFQYAPEFHPRFAATHPYKVRVEGYTPGAPGNLSSGSGVCTWLK